MDSQVEILRSEKISLSIINNLQLTKDPEFVGLGRGLVGTVMRAISLLTRSGPDTEFSLTRRALERFDRRLTVKRVGLTYTISIQFTSPSPERAAEIANAVAQAYTADQVETAYETARTTTEWLEGRVDVLRSKASDAQRAVADRKSTQLSTNQAQSELRELETSAQVYRRLYDTFLQRYLEAVEQQSIPVSQARLMTVASPPLKNMSSPKTFLVLALSIAGGIILGVGVALLRDASDLTFRTRDKVRAELHTDCIGIIPQPRVAAWQAARQLRSRIQFARDQERLLAPVASFGTLPTRRAPTSASCSGPSSSRSTSRIAAGSESRSSASRRPCPMKESRPLQRLWHNSWLRVEAGRFA